METFLEDEWILSYKKLRKARSIIYYKCMICNEYESPNIGSVRKHIKYCAAKTEQKRASSKQNNETNGTSEITDF